MRDKTWKRVCATALLRRTSRATLPWSVSSSISHGLSSTNAAISEPFQRICSKSLARYMIQPGIYTVISLALYLCIWHKGELVWVCESDKNVVCRKWVPDTCSVCAFWLRKCQTSPLQIHLAFFFLTAHTNTCNELVFCKAQSKYLTKINKGVFFLFVL